MTPLRKVHAPAAQLVARSASNLISAAVPDPRRAAAELHGVIIRPEWRRHRLCRRAPTRDARRAPRAAAAASRRWVVTSCELGFILRVRAIRPSTILSIDRTPTSAICLVGLQRRVDTGLRLKRCQSAGRRLGAGGESVSQLQLSREAVPDEQRGRSGATTASFSPSARSAEVRRTFKLAQVGGFAKRVILPRLPSRSFQRPLLGVSAGACGGWSAPQPNGARLARRAPKANSLPPAGPRASCWAFPPCLHGTSGCACSIRVSDLRS
jgi:hypothetical protein